MLVLCGSFGCNSYLSNCHAWLVSRQDGDAPFSHGWHSTVRQFTSLLQWEKSFSKCRFPGKLNSVCCPYTFTYLLCCYWCSPQSLLLFKIKVLLSTDIELQWILIAAQHCLNYVNNDHFYSSTLSSLKATHLVFNSLWEQLYEMEIPSVILFETIPANATTSLCCCQNQST